MGKWEDIALDFVTKLPRTKNGHNMIWVIVDRFMKRGHFLVANERCSMDKLADVYVKEIVRLHGVPLEIMSGWDSCFT